MAGGISSSPIPELTLVVRTLNKSFNSQWDVWPLLLPIPESKGCWVTPQAGWLRMGSRSVPPCTLNQGSRLANRTAVIRNKLSQQPSKATQSPASNGSQISNDCGRQVLHCWGRGVFCLLSKGLQHQGQSVTLSNQKDIQKGNM